MHMHKLVNFAVAGFSLALVLGGCSSGSGDNGGGGSGGSSSPGAGGATGSGGTTGSGGSSAGGTTGSGGSSVGGTTGAGGSSAGGATGAGGSGAGGSTGAGGESGRGGGGGSSAGGSGGGNGGRGGAGEAGRGGSLGTGGSGTGGSAGASGTFSLTSPSLADGAHFDMKFTCAAQNGTFGAGVNPELDWTGVPANTKSFAMTFIDTTIGENNAMGQHWAIWNIPWDGTTNKVSMLPEGLGATLTGDLANAKQNGKFLAPCAQMVTNNMDDQYAFTIYALSSATLNVQGTSVANALTALHAITPLGTAVLHGHAGLKGK